MKPQLMARAGAAQASPQTHARPPGPALQPLPAAPVAPPEPGRPTVLFVHQSSDLYGSDRVLLANACALQASGGHAIVVLPGAGLLVAALQERNIEVHVLTEWAVLKLSRSVMSPRGICRLLASVARARQELDRCLGPRSADLVVSNTLAVLAGAAWSWRTGVPHLWHVHEIVQRPRWAARLFPWLLRLFAQRVVCNSEATQDWLLGAQPRLAARTRVVMNGADDLRALLPGGTATQLLSRRFRPGGVPLAIGLVGRINRMKGHAVLLQAARHLLAVGICNFSLVFVGDAPPGQAQHTEQLQRDIAASGLAGRVVCTGFISNTSAAYAALDIVCVPSTEVESFGLVAIEAMAMALPVVASRIGGLAAVVEHHRTGLLHEAGDAQALADALALLLHNAPLRQAMGQAGRRRYEACYASATMQRLMLAELSQAARGGTA